MRLEPDNLRVSAEGAPALGGLHPPGSEMNRLVNEMFRSPAVPVDGDKFSCCYRSLMSRVDGAM